MSCQKNACCVREMKIVVQDRTTMSEKKTFKISTNGFLQIPGAMRPVRLLFSLLGLILSFTSSPTVALGPSPVSGFISTNTTWTASESPYVVSGDLQITSGALLSIQPGVTVLMNGEFNSEAQHG